GRGIGKRLPKGDDGGKQRHDGDSAREFLHEWSLCGFGCQGAAMRVRAVARQSGAPGRMLGCAAQLSLNSLTIFNMGLSTHVLKISTSCSSLGSCTILNR